MLDDTSALRRPGRTLRKRSVIVDDDEDTNAREVVTSTLVVARADSETKSVIWRGVASKDLDQNASPEKWDKNLNKAVAKMLEKYPPKQK
ncbi:MAG: DUF4136 domain-containing protein [Acidobacteriales bacterium]|nr:DUF4136 domain-containing protein [Terriglobales bacterium]